MDKVEQCIARLRGQIARFALVSSIPDNEFEEGKHADACDQAIQGVIEAIRGQARSEFMQDVEMFLSRLREAIAEVANTQTPGVSEGIEPISFEAGLSVGLSALEHIQEIATIAFKLEDTQK